MGVAALGVCHSTALDAAVYVCGTAYPTSPITVGAYAVQFQCSGATATALNIKRLSYPNTAGTATSVALTVPFQAPSCGLDSFSGDPFRLSLAEGALIAAAVLGVWGIAACWRELAAFINQGGNSNEDLK